LLRRSFLAAVLGAVLFPWKAIFAEEKKPCITTCADCRRDWECCRNAEIELTPQEMAWLSMEAKRRNLPIIIKMWWANARWNWSMVAHPCVFWDSQTHLCGVYEKRPKVCRDWYCDDWCASAIG